MSEVIQLSAVKAMRDALKEERRQEKRDFIRPLELSLHGFSMMFGPEEAFEVVLQKLVLIVGIEEMVNLLEQNAQRLRNLKPGA